MDGAGGVGVVRRVSDALDDDDERFYCIHFGSSLGAIQLHYVRNSGGEFGGNSGVILRNSGEFGAKQRNSAQTTLRKPSQYWEFPMPHPDGRFLLIKLEEGQSRRGQAFQSLVPWF